MGSTRCEMVSEPNLDPSVEAPSARLATNGLNPQHKGYIPYGLCIPNCTCPIVQFHRLHMVIPYKGALHIIAVLGEIRYESHNLESQLQLQLLNSNETVQKIKELKKKVEDIDGELGTAHSLIDNLKKELAKSSNIVSLRDLEIILLGNEVTDLKRQIFELRSDLSIIETVAYEAETRHRSKIEAARVAIVEE
ncbi:hypothetical protein F0562_032393 [Nyssa sinensis]|uniref:Uncharacterized protein n=1 Tax=Nyssa sinensis TaxID=561372 RepID=A0A5J5ARI3_9ASTE|nr:hypothetical protein F0562_032393 [Nyssa sinensis]